MKYFIVGKYKLFPADADTIVLLEKTLFYGFECDVRKLVVQSNGIDTMYIYDIIDSYDNAITIDPKFVNGN